MIITSYSDFNLYINNHKIEKVDAINYLGVIIDKQFNWKSHIKHLEPKLSQACGMMYRLRNFVNIKCLFTFQYSNVYSHLIYAVLSYASAKPSYLQKLNIIHRRIVRAFGIGKHMKISTDELFKNLELLKLTDIYKLELAKLMHRAENANLPDGFGDIIITPAISHNYSLRYSIRPSFKISGTRIDTANRAIANAGPRLWHTISTDKKKLSLRTFAKCLKTHLLSLY